MKHELFSKPAQESPQVLYARRDVNLKPGSRYGPVIRNVYIIECCASGYGSVIINGTEFPIGPGDCYILMPNDSVIHTTDTVDPRCGVYCVANGRSLGKLLAGAGISSSQPFAKKEVFHEIYDQIEQMLKFSAESDMAAELHRSACLHHILGALFHEVRNADKDTVIKRAIGIMETRYSEALSTQDIADDIGLERSYFSVFFKNHTGLPPHRYLTRLRVQKACVLMDRDNIPISTAADSVGLDSQNFSRIFKREMGITPMQYKQRLNGKESIE